MREDDFLLKVCKWCADKKVKEWSPFTAGPAGNAGRTDSKDGKVKGFLQSQLPLRTIAKSILRGGRRWLR